LNFGPRPSTFAPMSPGDRSGAREFGAALAKARAAAGVSLESVAERTKLSKTTLDAFEAGDFARLPSRTFARMFVRQIAAQLGEDESRWVTALEVAWDRFEQGSQVIKLDVSTAPRRRRAGPWIVGVVLVGAGLTLLFVLAARHPIGGGDEMSPTPSAILPLLAPTATPAPTPEATVATVPVISRDPNVMVIETSDRSCWVQVRRPGGGTESRLMAANSVWEIAAGGREVQIVLGNAGAIGRISYLGEVHTGVGREGEVLRLTLPPPPSVKELP
jgi:cytoskeleton protein RodZ